MGSFHRGLLLVFWVTLAAVVPFSCLSCAFTKPEPPAVIAPTEIVPEPVPATQPAPKHVVSNPRDPNDEADFLLTVFYRLMAVNCYGYEFRYEDLANAGLTSVADELKARGIAFTPKKIAGSRYTYEMQEVFRSEFHRAEKLSEHSGLAEHELIFLATDAALDSLRETHTYFVFPSGFIGRSRIGVGSRLVYGIGAQIRRYKNEFFFVDKIVPSGAAEKAGVKRFDRITKVNGDPAEDDLNSLISRIRGPDSTMVDVTVERAGTEMVFTMVRGELGELLADGEVTVEDTKRWSYVRFNQFGELDSYKIQMLNHDPGVFGTTVNGVVLDLRGNPGGRIVVLDQLLSYFLEKGSISFIEDGKNGKNVHVVVQEPIYHGKLVVLVDENSCSAAEMFASAIQTNSRGTIVGAKTTGFIAVGVETPLPYESSMLVMVSKVLDSNNAPLEYIGITPDVEVELTREDILAGRDVQLEKAWEILKSDKK